MAAKCCGSRARATFYANSNKNNLRLPPNTTHSIYGLHFINAANVYASHQSTSFKAEESRFEKRLMALFEKSRKSGVEKRYIALITSTALAVVLTKPGLTGTSKGMNQGRRILRMAEMRPAFSEHRQTVYKVIASPLLCCFWHK
jgi:hypothetical protein